MGDKSRDFHDEGLSRLGDQVEGLKREVAGSNGNVSTIHVDAGSVGVWIAAAACLVMLVMGIVCFALYLDQQRRLDDMQHYLNAIYMQAPHLKPEDE